MKTLNASLLSSGNPSALRFWAARQLAYSMAESDQEFIEPELIAWVDRSGAMFSPEAVGCFGPNGWHDYGMSHGGGLEVDVGDEASFIFTESGPYCSYDHFGHRPYVNLGDAQGNESICRPGGIACVPLDEWTGKLT